MPISEEIFFGGAIFQSISATLTVYSAKRVWTISATAGQVVKLPDATTLLEGGPYFYIINIGSNDFDLQDNDGNVLETVPQATTDLVLCCLANNSTSAGQWFTLLRATL